MRKLKPAGIFSITLFIALFSLMNFVLACDESEMQSMMTGNVAGSSMDNVSFSGSLGLLGLIKEILIVIVLALLAIWLIRQISKNKRRKN